MWKVRREKERRRTRRPDKRLAEVEKEGEKGEDETVVVKRRCVDPVSGDAFEELNHVEDSDSCGNSWCDFLGDSCGLSDCARGVVGCASCD